MEPEPTVLDSLRKAVEAMPDDVPLRLHLATMLLQAGQRDEAVRQIGAVLQRDPGNAQALGLLRDSGPGRLRPRASRLPILRSFLPNGPGCLPRRRSAPPGRRRPRATPGRGRQDVAL